MSRSTAPAGTPYPVAPASPAPAPAARPNAVAAPAPKVPAPTASQPRTVGGHTARLAVPEPEDDPLRFDSLGGSVPMVLHEGAPVSPPPARPVGGTVRLADDEVPVAMGAPPGAAPGSAPKPPLAVPMGASAPKPPVQTEKPAAAAPSVPAGGGWRSFGDESVPPSAPRRGPASRAQSPSSAGEGSGFLRRLFAPVSVAVGLVFFAMGCMIGLTIEGRFIQLTFTQPPASPSAQPSAAAPPVSAPVVITAMAPGVPPPPAVDEHPKPPTVTTGKPGPVPGVIRPPGQTTKRPPLPFP